MIWSFFKGIMLGLPCIFMLGPALFAILQTSIDKGFYSGMQMAFGIAASDILIMILCFLGASAFAQNIVFQISIGIGGSVFMLAYGMYLFFKKVHPKRKRREHHPELKMNINWAGVFSEVSKGFFLNIMNPFLWLWWFAVITAGTGGGTLGQGVAFIVGIEVVILSFDMVKAYFANKLTNLLTDSTIHRINRIAGVLLLGCAIVLLVRTLLVYHIIPCPFIS